jgi:hypothetical protein
MVSIQEYKNKKIEWIEKLIATAGLESFEVSDAVREMAKEYPDLKDWAEKMSTWRDSILDTESLEAADVYYDGFVKLVKNLMQKKHDKQRQEWQDDDQKNKEWWSDYHKKEQTNKEWLRKYSAGELDWQKDQKKRDEENKKKLEESEKKWEDEEKKGDEEWKKKFIGDIEMDLIKKNITGERLSKRLGVSDWREKISGAANFHEALSRRSDLWDIIRELKSDNDSEFTCASCGKKKKEYYNYPLEGGIKYCSAECWDKGNDKSKGRGKFENFDVNEFFGWMKKMGVSELRFDFDKKQVVIKLNNGKNLDIKESGLTKKQQQDLTNQLKSSSTPIRFSEINEEMNKKGKNSNSNVGVIALVLVIVGIIAIIITLIVRATGRNKD